MGQIFQNMGPPFGVLGSYIPGIFLPYESLDPSMVSGVHEPVFGRGVFGSSK